MVLSAKSGLRTYPPLRAQPPQTNGQSPHGLYTVSKSRLQNGRSMLMISNPFRPPTLAHGRLCVGQEGKEPSIPGSGSSAVADGWRAWADASAHPEFVPSVFSFNS